MSVECDEQTMAYGLCLLNWIALTILALFTGVSLSICKFSLELDDIAWKGVSVFAVLAAAGHCLLLWARGARLAFVLISISQLAFLSMLGALLTYIAASANLPLRDAMLDRWDRMLGLDWAAYYRFMTAWPGLLPYVHLSYGAILLPPFGVPIVLGLTKNYVRLQRFTMATLLTICVAAFISALIPAIGTYQLYDLPTDFGTVKATGYLIQLERLPVIRSGGLDVLILSQIGGIVTFPSFHTAAAVLALWAWWSVWWMRPWAFMMCAAMIMATPLLGGHYFVDCLAGGVLACLAIASASMMKGRSFTFSGTFQPMAQA